MTPAERQEALHLVEELQRERAGAAHPAVERDDAIMSLELSVSEIFRTVKNSHRQLAQGFDPPLSMFGFGVLRFLRQHGPVRVGDLAQAFETDKAVVSRQLAALRERGYVVHRDDPSDRRASLIELSEEAQTQFTAARTQLRDSYHHLVDDWSDDELASFAAMLERFARALPR